MPATCLLFTRPCWFPVVRVDSQETPPEPRERWGARWNTGCNDFTLAGAAQLAPHEGSGCMPRARSLSGWKASKQPSLIWSVSQIFLLLSCQILLNSKYAGLHRMLNEPEAPKVIFKTKTYRSWQTPCWSLKWTMLSILMEKTVKASLLCDLFFFVM